MDDLAKSCTMEGAVYDYVMELHKAVPPSEDAKLLADQVPAEVLAGFLKQAGILAAPGQAHEVFHGLPPCHAAPRQEDNGPKIS